MTRTSYVFYTNLLDTKRISLNLPLQSVKVGGTGLLLHDLPLVPSFRCLPPCEVEVAVSGVLKTSRNKNKNHRKVLASPDNSPRRNNFTLVTSQ